MVKKLIFFLILRRNPRVLVLEERLARGRNAILFFLLRRKLWTLALVRGLVLGASLVFIFLNFGKINGLCGPETKGGIMEIKVTSSAFKEGGMIPKKYTGQGEDVSPPLSWSAVPEGTKSIALISDDPDAPAGTWLHWVLYNIPPDTKNLAEDIPPEKTLPNGARHGINDFRKIGYGGPYPPAGTHRYYFKIYALDKVIELPSGATKEQLLKAMEGHILAQGQLMGRYKKE